MYRLVLSPFACVACLTLALTWQGCSSSNKRVVPFEAAAGEAGVAGIGQAGATPSSADAGTGGVGTGAAGQAGMGAADGGSAGEATGGAAGEATGGEPAGGAAAGGAGAPACTIDTIDPFEGTWLGGQGSEAWIVTNKGGCSDWQGKVGDTLCDTCAGTYTADGAASLACVQVASCGSPSHQDIGTLMVSGCTLSYAYNFGGGDGVWSGLWSSPATANVCPK